MRCPECHSLSVAWPSHDDYRYGCWECGHRWGQSIEEVRSEQEAAFRSFNFYLGTGDPGWLSRLDVPLFVSARRLRLRKRHQKSISGWAMDSGGFSELSLYGRWSVSDGQFVAEVYRWRDQIGNLRWVAQQDWMCEPVILAKTGLTVREHQKRSTDNWFSLRKMAPDLPWLPVLQGWVFDDYLKHAEDYQTAGIDLARLPLIGVGSICRRQNTLLAEELVSHFKRAGVRLHAFGLKTLGLKRMWYNLTSADSMAWSYRARKNPPLAGCTHKHCNNCYIYALLWREKVLRSLRQPPKMRQNGLFDKGSDTQ